MTGKGQGKDGGESVVLGVTCCQERTAVLPLFTEVNEKISFWGITKVKCNDNVGGGRKDQGVKGG